MWRAAGMIHTPSTLLPIYGRSNVRQKTPRFSYADDSIILRIGRIVVESVVVVLQEGDSLLGYIRANLVLFDIDKSKFNQSYGRKHEEPVRVNFSEKTFHPAEHIRWLGVHLNSRL